MLHSKTSLGKNLKIFSVCGFFLFSSLALAINSASPNYMITYQKYEKTPLMVKLDNGNTVPMNGYYIENSKVPAAYKTVISKNCQADGDNAYLLSVNSGKGEMLFCEKSKKALGISTKDFLKNG